MPRQHLKRRPDGRYICRYKKQWFTGATEKEALEARERYKFKEKQGLLSGPGGATVRAYACAWLPLHKHNVSPKCYNDYAKQLDAMLDVIGDMLLQDVKPSDMMKVWQHYDGYSASTIKRSRQLFFSMFDTAMDDGLIRTNPMKSKHAKPPKGTEGTHRSITDRERELIVANKDHFFYPAVMTMLYAGLRRGEALALNIDRDVDFENHCIHVREAVRFDSNQPILSDPKTEAGLRTIPMLSILEDVLRGRTGLLAPARRSNGHMSEVAFNSAWNGFFRSIECKLNGVKQKRWRDRSKEWETITVRSHDLRHSYCTMLRDAGVDMKLAMTWMGHADEKMILKVYDHVSDYRVTQAVSNLESMLAG